MKIWTYAYVRNGEVIKLEGWRVNGNADINLSIVGSNHLREEDDYTLVFIGACIDFPLKRAAYYDDPMEWYHETKLCNIPFKED